MSKHVKLSTKEFQFLYSYQSYTENRKQQQEQKLKILSKVISAYGDTYYNLKEKTRQVVEMICWFSAEKGYCFAKENYFANRFGVSAKTVRNIFKKLREAGLVCTIYRHSTTQNGLGAAIHLFLDHPYFGVWEKKFHLPTFQAGCQAENEEIPCESKDDHPKKVSTKYLSFSKDLLKILRKENRLDYTYTPKNVPETFVKTVKPFFSEAKDIYTLWGKAVLAYQKFSLSNVLEDYSETVIEAFRQSIFAHKHRKIRKDFTGYFYGTLMKMFTYKKREETFDNHPTFFNWLENPKKEYSLRFEKKSWQQEIENLIAKEERTLAFELEEIPY